VNDVNALHKESVWDYPRPPRMEPDGRRILVRHGELVLADSRRSYRVLETSHPPVFYVPPEAVRTDRLTRSSIRTMCEFKGVAHYWDLRGASTIPQVAWSYPTPLPGYEDIAGWFAFYADRVECFVDRERARPQASGFYGGWITSEIVGPFKGHPGSQAW
jgi:uncharacterized protein (DUF427 family)